MRLAPLCYIAAISVLAACSVPTDSQAQNLFGPSQFSEVGDTVLVAWNTEEGQNRLHRAIKTDFYQLAHRFQPQINPLYCGIATTTILLNSTRLDGRRVPSQEQLEVERPKAFGGGRIPFRAYSQTTLLNRMTDQVKSRTVITLENLTDENTHDASQFDPGLTLQQLAEIQRSYGLEVEVQRAGESFEAGVAAFRGALRKHLSDEDHFIVVNFVGTAIGTTTQGHISPLAAFDPESDTVLVLDVAGHKNPWYWVPIQDLYLSMHTKDGPHYRGWLIVQDPTSP